MGRAHGPGLGPGPLAMGWNRFENVFLNMVHNVLGVAAISSLGGLPKLRVFAGVALVLRCRFRGLSTLSCWETRGRPSMIQMNDFKALLGIPLGEHISVNSN
jgi:hypothetical protein